jgi:hypothetical protein
VRKPRKKTNQKEEDAFVVNIRGATTSAGQEAFVKSTAAASVVNTRVVKKVHEKLPTFVKSTAAASVVNTRGVNKVHEKLPTFVSSTAAASVVNTRVVTKVHKEPPTFVSSMGVEYGVLAVHLSP